jgi:predicted N-acetyltransferase YhbS
MIVPFQVEAAVPADHFLIETMLDHAFGLARRARTSYRLREGNAPVPGLSLVVREAEIELAGAISFWPLVISFNAHPALLLGPLVVHWQRQNRGIGLALMNEGLRIAKALGHRLVILVGDEPYYARVGFKQVPEGRLMLPGPVDPQRFLYLELVEGSLADAQGLVLPPYRHAELQRPSRAHASEINPSASANAMSDANSG